MKGGEEKEVPFDLLRRGDILSERLHDIPSLIASREIHATF